MRKFIVIFFLFTTSICSAQDSVATKHEIYLGVNLTRLVAQDCELQLFYRITNRSMVGLSGRYDVNWGGRACTTSYPASDTGGWQPGYIPSLEAETRETSRYFFGQGPALRLSYNYMWQTKKQNVKILTAEMLLKIRDYDNYWYKHYEELF